MIYMSLTHDNADDLPLVQDPFQTDYNVARTVTVDGLFTVSSTFYWRSRKIDLSCLRKSDTRGNR